MQRLTTGWLRKWMPLALSVLLVPWCTWVTSAVYTLKPNAPRYTKEMDDTRRLEDRLAWRSEIKDAVQEVSLEIKQQLALQETRQDIRHKEVLDRLREPR